MGKEGILRNRLFLLILRVGGFFYGLVRTVVIKKT